MMHACLLAWSCTLTMTASMGNCELILQPSHLKIARCTLRAKGRFPPLGSTTAWPVTSFSNAFIQKSAHSTVYTHSYGPATCPAQMRHSTAAGLPCCPRPPRPKRMGGLGFKGTASSRAADSRGGPAPRPPLTARRRLPVPAVPPVLSP